MRRLLLLLLAFPALLCPAQDLMTPELLWKLGRVTPGSVSPDGKEVLYGVRHYDLAANKGDTEWWRVPVAGGGPVPLLSGPDSESDVQWAMTPAGLRVFMVATREGNADAQVWALDPKGGAWTRVTAVAGGVANLKVAPGGRRIAFTREVKLDPEVKDLFPDLPKAEARIIDGLMYRHWDHWREGTYTHVHVAELGEDGTAGPAADLMEGLRFDCPIPPFAGSEHFAWSPDGEQIALSIKMAADWAASTDADVYLVDLEGERKLRCITAGMDGYDLEPRYSPDGRYLLFHSMERAGFEADRNRVMVYDRKEEGVFEATEGLDQTAHGTRWTPDSKGLLFASELRGTEQVFHLDLESRALRQVTGGAFDWSLDDVTPDGGAIVCGRQDMTRPVELYRVALASGEAVRLTQVNDAHFAGLGLPRVAERWTRATDGQRVQSWVIYPPGFDKAKRYPMITYCQGGPQSQIGQWFSFRWNFHLMAAKGYVVLAVNRRGLPGFGQSWNDQISGDWGGQPMQDLLAATDDLLTEPYVDARRVAAVGASFGGYTVYWLMGNAPDRFACMVAHCGVFNLESMYTTTEELFFVNWDLGGPYWRSAELQAAYDRFSPHRFVGAWKTPLLVVHGAKDFRVPVEQGMGAFNAAQIEGVPSRFLYFPNEGHWVLSPQNGVLWQRVFFDWLDRHCKPRG